MADLVSPGLQITVSDESQYVPAGTGTVPLVLFATASNKAAPSGTTATGTTAANANKLQAFGSQRELINAFGYPKFQTAAGTPIHGHELNEYGLQAAYSAMGLGNRMFALRADIDLDQLVGKEIRPKGNVVDGFVWLDLANTRYGVYEWNLSTQSFTNKIPVVITDSDLTVAPAGEVLVYTPIDSYGEIGTYAIVSVDGNNPLFYKNSSNAWVAVGTKEWQKAWPTVTTTLTNDNVLQQYYGETMTINSVSFTITNYNNSLRADLVDSINNAFAADYGDGIQAAIDANGRVVIYATSDAMGNGTDADGRVVITRTEKTDALGITIPPGGSFFAPNLAFGSYTQVPTFAETDATPAPTGAVWIKTSSIGTGANWAFKTYSASTSKFVATSAPMYEDRGRAIFGLDPLNGGIGIASGAIYVDLNTVSTYPGTFKAYKRFKTGVTKVTGTIPNNDPFTIGHQFKLAVTQPGSIDYSEHSFTIDSVSTDGFVRKILAAAIPNVFASMESTGAISITHKSGGEIYLVNVTGTALADAGFTSGTTGIVVESTGDYAGDLLATNWTALSYTQSTSTPYVAPDDGTLWYFSSAVEADIMICGTDGWKGYRSGSLGKDARGYDLTLTDPNGPIFSATTPTLQTTGLGIVKGDLWVDTSDLENYPKISRYNGTKWVAIDNTDRITQNGIVFADARWDAAYINSQHVGGIIDPVTGTLPAISTMLVSNYTDLDCPDYRLYPRGTIMWNTRRNGFNVKEYVSEAFTEQSYPNAGKLTNNTAGNIPTQSATWVSASGNQDDGTPYMGHKAQRHMVVKALRAAIDSNTQIREEQYNYNLIVCPGYPELISNMVSLNNDRSNTAFIVADTPMDLKPNTIDLTEWSNNVATTADVYTAIYYPAGLTNDLSGNEIAVPASHMALRTFVHSDAISYQWFAPAGARRGLVDNATAVGYVDYTSGLFVKTGVRQSLRDSLYQLRINPIATLPGLGLVVFGQKTRSPIAQSMDRVNVARLVNYIRGILSGISNSFLFEPNDKITRDQIKQIIEGAMNDLIAKRGIYDYLVVCDNSNNTPERIARNELYVDIAIEPMKAVEFIYIPIRLKNPGSLGGAGK
jgi:hypothetical protein